MDKALTKDSMIWPDLQIFQKKNGYRFSLDSVILARLIKSKKSDSLLEIGSGCGVILLILAKLNSFKRMVGIEIQRDLWEISIKNKKINKAKQIEFINSDINKFSRLEKIKFDIIAANPPYYKIGSGRLNKTDEVIRARHEKTLTLNDLISSSKRLLKPKGAIYLIYSAKRGAELFDKMREFRIEPKLVLPIYSKKTTNADLIWIKGINNAKSDLKMLPPLTLYDEKGNKTETFKKFYLPSKSVKVTSVKGVKVTETIKSYGRVV